MTDFSLTFTVSDVIAEACSVTPALTARLRVTAGEVEQHIAVQAIALRCQIRIDPARRRYSDSEAEALTDLFGPRERWANTQHTFLWQHATTMVPGFTTTTEVDLPISCTYDFEVTAAKYLHGLVDGAIPLQFLFSGTVFVAGPRGFAVVQVPWDREDRYDLPVAVWHRLIGCHYPNTGWVRLHHDTVAALAAYRSAHGLLSFDDAVDALIARTGVPSP